ncbi:hypothetical protein FA13DRAFT_1624301 [Coprinellus micaceus]|uniref:Uncharacterized protein n=1 Tax=Coprinellus micaceus TaxID=71717 RepID=A0A4Y7TM95_COPMI|nr:hypothetical protein FA13DRAFT_1624301 [Coprinellus micaceus]
MATEQEQKAEGKGLQNFPYPPGFYELCQIIRDISAQAYEALSKHLHMPSIRSIQQTCAREPRFPMTICPDTFKLVENQLNPLGTKGPVALSCNDMKLLDTMRMYWDEKEGKHYLVGAMEGKLEVADPEQMKKVLEEAKYQKATKVQVRVWCLSLPSPKITPIIVATLPIIDKLKAEHLFPLLQQILDGLIDRGIRVISYASDGTEVERKASDMLFDIGEKVDFIIPNPFPEQSRPNTCISYVKYRGQAICVLQDSKHGLKTMQNNLFSGARLLVLGNHIAAY